MTHEKSGLTSSIGQALMPDLSGEEDLGGAVRQHVGDITSLLRAAKVCAEHTEDIHTVEDLLELAIEGLDNLCEAFEIEESNRMESKPVRPAGGKLRTVKGGKGA